MWKLCIILKILQVTSANLHMGRYVHINWRKAEIDKYYKGVRPFKGWKIHMSIQYIYVYKWWKLCKFTEIWFQLRYIGQWSLYHTCVSASYTLKAIWISNVPKMNYFDFLHDFICVLSGVPEQSQSTILACSKIQIQNRLLSQSQIYART